MKTKKEKELQTAPGTGRGRGWERARLQRLAAHTWDPAGGRGQRAGPAAHSPGQPWPLFCGGSALPWAGSAPCRPWRVGRQTALGNQHRACGPPCSVRVSACFSAETETQRQVRGEPKPANGRARAEIQACGCGLPS